MKVQPISKIRAELQENFDQVHYNKQSVIVTKNSKPWVIIKPLSEEDKNLQKLVTQKKRD